jgi:hypothetical protein
VNSGPSSAGDSACASERSLWGPSVEEPAVTLAAVAELQNIAELYLQLQQDQPIVTTIKVARLIDSRHEWRMIETERSATGTSQRRKRLLCFDTAEDMRRALLERVAWRRADEDFVANNMSTPGDLPGVTAEWVHSKDFDEVFSAPRSEVRKRICRTVPVRMVNLSS